MISEVVMPRLGQTMEEGTIVDWIKKEGGPVQCGDLLFTVESDKAVLGVAATVRGSCARSLSRRGSGCPR